MSPQNHVHTFVKYKKKPGFMRCDAPDCIYWIDKELIINKISRCTQCGTEFQLTREDLKRSRPRCLNCSNTEQARKHRIGQDLMRDFGTESFNPFKDPVQMELEEPE